MTTGNLYVGLAPEYEDYTSLKKYIRHSDDKWEKMNLIRTTHNQAGTGSEVDISDPAGQTVVTRVKTELTLVMASDTNDNAYDTETVTVHYLDADGVTHEALATYDPTATTTEVPFNDAATGLVPVTDFYGWDYDYETLAIVSSVAVQAGDNVCIGITGCVAGIADPDLCYATILATATSPTLANMYDQGSVWGGTEADHSDATGAIMTLEYTSPWGAVTTGATCTLTATGLTTPIRFFKADGVHYVNDYYITRSLPTDTTPTTNTHAFYICDFDAATIYGAIEEASFEAVHTKYMLPAGRDAWFAHFCVSQAIATNLDCYMTMTLIPYAKTGSHTCTISIPNNGMNVYDPLLRMAEKSVISFLLKGNHSDNAFDFHIIEAIQH